MKGADLDPQAWWKAAISVADVSGLLAPIFADLFDHSECANNDPAYKRRETNGRPDPIRCAEPLNDPATAKGNDHDDGQRCVEAL